MMKSNTHNNNEGNRNRAALVWMMIHVIVSSFVVFIIDWGETNKSPFFFSAIQHFFAFFVFFFISLRCSTKTLITFQKRFYKIYCIFTATRLGSYEFVVSAFIIDGMCHYPHLFQKI